MEVFVINSNEIEGRFDPNYHKVKVNSDNLTRLNSIAIIKGGKRLPKGHYYSTVKTDYSYLKVSDMSELGIDYSNLSNISNSTFDILKRYKIEKNEILISIAGTIGKISWT